MLRKLLGKDSNAPSAAEDLAIMHLAATYRRILTDGGRINTKSEAGYQACAMFLDGLDSAARTMRLDAASRSYRIGFTINYRALFPDEARNYRVDVLEASVEQYAVIWVNGDKFEFSQEAMRRADALQSRWSELCALLDLWSQACEQQHSQQRPSRSDLRSALVALDSAWASFEDKYISELIEIEGKARRMIVQAIEHERRIQYLEAQHGEGEALEQIPEYQEELMQLVGCIARLNSVANFRRKGRDDLGVNVLLDASATLRRCTSAEQDGQSSEALSAARILATDIVESFAAMRDYLREVERCLERVDPHLCNNQGIVARLVDWEESWEVGARYVQNQRLLHAVCDLVREIRVAQHLVPALTDMCEECDVELFLVLPRIIWLRFLNKPSEQSELLKSLLPHRFKGSNDKEKCQADSMLQAWDTELDNFIDQFWRAKNLLRGALPSTGPASDSGESEILLKRVILGAGDGDLYKCLLPDKRDIARAAAEELINKLESFSIELQRHCPEDWNQCSAILVQCLTSSGEKQKQSTFRV